jgi:DUF971 family protein
MSKETPMSANAKQQTILAPQKIHLHRRERMLEVSWPDGRVHRISCLALRAACACSSCTQALRSGRLALYDADITLAKVEVFGASALQLFFSDGHSRGLYPWAYLRKLGEGV